LSASAVECHWRSIEFTIMTDRNLLFGVFVLQADLIDVRQFIEICTVWAARKTTDIGDLLIERGWLTVDDKAHVEHLVERRLLRPGKDVRAVYSRLPTAARQSLMGLGDAEIQQSMGGLPDLNDATSIASSGAETERRYASMRLHAVGGIGRVWLARDSQLGRDVALKDLKPEHVNNRTAQTRFLREARITGQLEHPGIVPVYELARHAGDGQPFYTMRFVKGRTMTDATRAHHAKRQAGRAESLELLGLLNAFVIVCNTIGYAHSRGIIHRDLKGQNVVLGDFGEVMVLDWGLAKVIDDPDETAGPSATIDSQETAPPDLTRHGQTIGTPAYMAPEQAAGRLDRVDRRTDVYGLGAMLYEILTGQPPFTGGTTRDVLDRVLSAQPVPPRQLWSDVPALLEAACLRALDKDPAARFGSPVELGREVQQWQETERQRAEDALRASEELYHSLVETIPMNVWRKDADGRYTFANRGLSETVGLPVEQILGRTDFDITTPELARQYHEGDNLILSTGHTYRATEEIVAADGRRITVHIVKLPVRDGRGRIVGTQGILWV
jgi:eukaryotic-like serine/threonine-protein kinase